jgi:hypothetical protein
LYISNLKTNRTGEKNKLHLKEARRKENMINAVKQLYRSFLSLVENAPKAFTSFEMKP